MSAGLDTVQAAPIGRERAAGYLLLASAFCYPDEEALRPLLEDAVERGGAPATTAAALLRCVDAELPGEYNRLFAQGVAVSPYERSYLGGDLGVGLGQLAALYQAFGVRAGGDEGEVADHIGAELEFAALLCAKEALHADEPGPEAAEALAAVRAARRTFLQEHLGRWSGPFAERLAARTDHPFYQMLAQQLAAFMEAERQREAAGAGSGAPALGGRRGVHLPVLPQGPAVDEDDMTCPMA